MQTKLISVLTSKYFIVLILTVGAFYKTFFYGATVTPANFQYTRFPWSSVAGVERFGPAITDHLDVYMPTISFMRTALLNGELPTWNPYIGMGTSNLQPLSAMVLNVLNWPIFIFGLEYGFFLKCFLKVFLVLLGGVFLLQYWRIPLRHALMGAVILAFCGQYTSWFIWSHTDVLTFAPWFMGSVLRYFDDSRKRHFAGAVFFAVQMMMGGMPAYFFYVVYFFLLVVLSIQKPFSPRKFFRLALKGLPIVVIASLIGLLPFGVFKEELEFLRYLDKRVNKFKMVFPVEHLINYISPFEGHGRRHPVESTVFVGFTAVALGILSILKTRAGGWLFVTLMSVIAFVVVGTHSQILNSIFGAMPIINTSSKIRIAIVASLALAILVPLFVNKITSRNAKLLVTAICAGGVIYTYNQGLYYLSAHMKDWTLGFAIFVGVLVWVKERKILDSILLGLIIFELLGFWHHRLPGVSGKGKTLAAPTESIKFLQEKVDHMKWRSTCIIPGGWDCIPGLASYYQYKDVAGHHLGFTDRNKTRFIRRIQKGAYKSATRVALSSTSADNRNLDLASVRYILRKEPWAHADASEDIELIAGPLSDGGYIYENKNALPLVYFVRKENVSEDKAGNLTITHLSDVQIPETYSVGINNASIEFNAPSAGYVVYTDSFHYGWHASLNDQSVPVLRFNKAFKAVAVTAGQNQVEYSFTPGILYVYASISLAGIFLFFIYLRWLHRPIVRFADQLVAAK